MMLSKGESTFMFMLARFQDVKHFCFGPVVSVNTLLPHNTQSD